jgi:uncharacterized protein YhbP (UPF0306 family)
MPAKNDSINRLKTFFQSQKLTALATQERDGPYLNLMAFSWTEDLNYLIIATKQGTRKYANMMKNPGVALLVDNRSDRGADFQNTLAVTGIGKAMGLTEAEKASLTALFLENHPELEAFVKSPECALMKIRIEKYIIISRFEESEELDMT